MKRFFFVGALLLFFSPLCEAETQSAAAVLAPKEEFGIAPQEDPPLGVFTFLTKIPGDYAATAKSLFSRETLLPFLAVAGSTALLINSDYELWVPFHYAHNDNKFFHDFTEIGWDVGKGGFQFGVAGAFLAAGAIWGNHRALRTASQIVEVVLATGITTQVLKRISGRESPSVATSYRTGRWQWFPNLGAYSRRVSAYDAFPSGHIATTFAVSRVIQLNYPEQKWIPYVTYPVLAYVGVSMVATNGHWWSDYPLSILLGWHFAKAVTRGNSPYEEKADPTALQWDPFIPRRGDIGVMLSKQF